MRKEARILYLYDPEIESTRVLADTLHNALAGWDITVTPAKRTTLLFDSHKFNVVHLFMPVGSKAANFVRKLSGKTNVIHTIVAGSNSVADYKEILSADRLIVFCESDRQKIKELQNEVLIDFIPPTVSLPDINLLHPSSELRNKFEVGEKVFAIALNDMTNKDQFNAFLYMVREYNRRGEFRLLVPRFHMDHETTKWRKELQNQIEKEKLYCATLLEDEIDLHSLIDSTDIALYLRKDRDNQFDFPLSMIEAMVIGKPVLSFDIPPFNETIKGFRKNWSCRNIEDFVRESKDIRNSASNLEQISTELARYARTIFSMDRVASLHRSIYTTVLNRLDARVS